MINTIESTIGSGSQCFLMHNLYSLAHLLRLYTVAKWQSRVSNVNMAQRSDAYVGRQSMTVYT